MSYGQTDIARWLLAPSPSSPIQARLGGWYRNGRLILRNGQAISGLCIVAAFFVLAIFGPMVTSSSTAQDLAQRLAPPSLAHLFGTDDLGRDILARITLACRSALLMIAIVCALIAPIGLVVGMVAGYFGGWLDVVLMRLTDVFLAFPRLVLALALAAALGPGFGNTVLAIVVTSWPAYARLARTETLLIRDSEFIESATLQGASPFYILIHHVAPLCTPTILLRLTLDVAAIILTAAGLGFLGLGAQPPAPELGTMVAEGRDFLYQQWWVATIPGATILLLSLGFNLIGEGVRDAASR